LLRVYGRINHDIKCTLLSRSLALSHSLTLRPHTSILHPKRETPKLERSTGGQLLRVYGKINHDIKCTLRGYRKLDTNFNSDTVHLRTLRARHHVSHQNLSYPDTRVRNVANS